LVFLGGSWIRKNSRFAEFYQTRCVSEFSRAVFNWV
jgi:hypothetical protein